MSPFTFDFDVEDDLDESFDVTPPKPSIPPIDAVPPQVAQINYHTRSRSQNWSVPHPFPHTRYTPHRRSPPQAAAQLPRSPKRCHTRRSRHLRVAGAPALVRRDLFDARFQLLAHEHDEQAAQVGAPADLVPGMYEGGFKT
jgi:hypothetical protein